MENNKFNNIIEVDFPSWIKNEYNKNPLKINKKRFSIILVLFNKAINDYLYHIIQLAVSIDGERIAFCSKFGNNLYNFKQYPILQQDLAIQEFYKSIKELIVGGFKIYNSFNNRINIKNRERITTTYKKIMNQSSNIKEPLESIKIHNNQNIESITFQPLKREINFESEDINNLNNNYYLASYNDNFNKSSSINIQDQLNKSSIIIEQ